MRDLAVGFSDLKSEVIKQFSRQINHCIFIFTVTHNTPHLFGNSFSKTSLVAKKNEEIVKEKNLKSTFSAAYDEKLC